MPQQGRGGTAPKSTQAKSIKRSKARKVANEDGPSGQRIDLPAMKQGKKKKKNKRQPNCSEATKKLTENRTQAIKDTRGTYPENIRIIEKNVKSNGSILAGYMGCSTFGNLLEIINGKSAQDVFLGLEAAKCANWGTDGTVLHPKTRIRIRHVIKQFQIEDSDITKQVICIQNPTIDDPCFDLQVNKNSQSFQNAIIIGFYICFINSHRPLFQSVYNSPEFAYHHGYYVEDLYRVHCMYIYWRDSIKKGKALSDGQLAAQVRYYTDDEIKEHPTELITQADPSEVDMQQRFRIDIVKVNELPHTNHESGHKDNSQVERKELLVIDKVISSLLSSPPHPNFGKDYRPHMSRREIRDHMALQADKCQILHDAFLNPIFTPEIEEKIVRLATDTLYGDELGVDGAQDDATQVEIRRIRDIVRETSADNPDFEQSCIEFGLESSADFKKNPQLEDRFNTLLIPTALQISACKHMRDTEKKVIKGGIIGDDYDLGKMTLALLHIAFQAEQIQDAYDRGESIVAKPTLIVAPPNLIQSWYTEWSKWFSKYLNLRQIFGQPNDYHGEGASIVVEPEEPESIKELENQLPVIDPASARVIFLSSYPTWQKRTLERKDRQEDTESNTGSTMPPRKKLKREGIEVERVVVHLDATKKQERDAAVDDKNFTYTSRYAHFFGRVILDEAHVVKNTRTLSHRSISALFAPITWFLSATPIVDRVDDLLGYLVLLWREPWDATLLKDPFDEGLYKHDHEFLYEGHQLYSTSAENHMATRGNDLYKLNPRRYALLSNRNLMHGTLAQEVTRSILRLIMLRRTIATVVHAYGEDATIASQIPSYHPVFVELDWTHAAQDHAYQILWDQQVSKLMETSDINNATAIRSFQDVVTHHYMSLVTFDLRQDILLRRLGLKSTAQEVQRHEWADLGPVLYNYLTRTDCDNPLCESWRSLADYICSKSPKLQYLMKLLAEGRYAVNTKLRGKTIIVCQWSIEVWLVSVLLKLLDFKFAISHARMTPVSRAEVYHHFGNDESCEVLVVSIKNGVLDLNGQHLAHRMVIMSVPSDVRTLLQCITCIHRYGQLKEQYIYVLNIDHSYDQYLQASAVAQLSRELAGDFVTKEITREELMQLARQEGITVHEGGEWDKWVAAKKSRSVQDQINLHIKTILGLRCSREGWAQPDLSAKDKLPSQDERRREYIPLADEEED